MATDSSGELVVTTNLPTYTPYASSTRLFNALAVVATDGADLEITVTNSQADRDSAAPLEYYYIRPVWYTVRFNRAGYIGADVQLKPNSDRAPADPREHTEVISLPADFSAQVSQFGWSYCVEAWPYPRTLPFTPVNHPDPRRRRFRIWVFSATAAMTAPLFPVLDYLPFKLRNTWADLSPASTAKQDARISSQVRSVGRGTHDTQASLAAELDRRHRMLGLSGQQVIRPPGYYETERDMLVPTFPGADAAVTTAMDQINTSIQTQNDRNGYAISWRAGSNTWDIDMVLSRTPRSLEIRADEEGWARFGSEPTLRYTMHRLGRELGTIDFPMRLIAAGAGVSVVVGDVVGDTDDTTGTGGYSAPTSIVVPIGGRAPVTITLTEPAEEDTTFTISLPDDAEVELSATEVTIPEGSTTATVYVEDNTGSGVEQTTSVTITPPEISSYAASTVDVSVRAETPALVPTPSTFYTVDGLIQSTDDTDSVGYEMDASWGGESVFKDGAWHYLPGHARAPVAHISPADILAYDLRQIGPDAQDRINAASMSIAQNKDGDYLPFRLDTQVLEDARLVDGTPYEADLGTRGFITDSVHARQALSIALRRTRYPTLTALRISPGAKLERLAIHPGDIVTYTDARYGVYGERNRVMSSTVHPDLSMTLSLRGEPVTTYDPALPYLPPAAPTEPLWRRLFRHPDADNRFIGQIAVDGSRLLLPGPRPGSGYSVVEYSTAGEEVGDVMSETRARDLNGIAFYRDGNTAKAVALHQNSLSAFGRIPNPTRFSNELGGSTWKATSMALRHGPGAPTTGGRAGFLVVERGISDFGFWLVTFEFSKFKDRTPFGGATIGSRSTLSNRTGNPQGMVERLDGSFLVVNHAPGEGFYPVSSGGAQSETAAFTFQGVGDETTIFSLAGMCVAPDGRLYVVARVAIGDDSQRDYIYVRRNAVEPDEERE